MPLTLPNLDDRTYADLVEEARAMIPTLSPEWTDHNPTDPGITLIELFAYLTEMLIYRLNRVTDAQTIAFLKLLNGLEWEPSESRTLADEIRDAVQALRQIDRAVTGPDYEELARRADDARVARARCVPRRNLESGKPGAAAIPAPGHVSVVIVPHSDDSAPQPDGDLVSQVHLYLHQRRLLTTRLHVVGPRYLTVGVRITLGVKPDFVPEDVGSQAVEALRHHLHPLTGGPAGEGWPFGRNVYVSEIYDLLDRQPGVDYVQRTVNGLGRALDEIHVKEADEWRKKYNGRDELVEVEVRANELVDARIDESDLTLILPPELSEQGP